MAQLREECNVRDPTTVTQVMMKIKELIASGVYKSNDRIPTENELAGMFGVGRSSVREALKTFQYLGVLEPRVPKGTFVCEQENISSEAITWSLLLGHESVTDIIELREVLEAQAVNALFSGLQSGRKAAQCAVEGMHRAVGAMADAAANNDIQELIDSDYEFHLSLVGAAENLLFVSILKTLHSFLREQIRRAYLAVESLSEIVEDHRDVLATLTGGEAGRAVERHRAHFDRVRRLLDESSRTTNDHRETRTPG
ncbi:MAG TPA: GntR family transcriptional regulator [Spirochaetia bacterium]|nr:GntR family transcriptional regulator [Spirochaetia bacterium]